MSMLPATKGRPVQMTLSVQFKEGSRKVTPADLERAAQAAAAAFRASLEACRPAYSIEKVEGGVTYSYVQAHRTFTV